MGSLRRRSPIQDPVPRTHVTALTKRNAFEMTPRKPFKSLKVVQAPDPVPAHLSERSKGLWREVEKSFVLEATELELLRLACEALDRCEEARAVLARDGLFTTNRANRPVAHPGVSRREG
jgi:phage terminase small subunit